jgi:DNA-binding HxlR family transcriptional regulator
VRTYDQYCAAAKALDVVGDRWTLLIVRELLIRDGCRYTDLQYGLPGIATNLLADRLRELEEQGIVRCEDAPPPIATTLYRLTERGRALKPVLLALGEWGSPLLAEARHAAREPAFRSHWLALPLEHQLRDAEPDQPPVTVEVRTGEQPVLLRTDAGAVHVQPGTVPEPDATLEGPPGVVMAVLTRGLDLDAARRQGLRVTGDPGAVRRVAVPAGVGAAGR